MIPASECPEEGVSSGICNDDDTICHQNIMLDDGVTACNCQQTGGCHIDQATCPYAPPFVYSPRVARNATTA